MLLTYSEPMSGSWVWASWDTEEEGDYERGFGEKIGKGMRNEGKRELDQQERESNKSHIKSHGPFLLHLLFIIAANQ